MICEHCKERHANVTVTQVQQGQKVERHYCEVCAAQIHPFQFEMQEEPISLQQFITNWFGSPIKQNTSHSQHEKKVQCSNCSMTYQQFLKKGKFGCANCYQAFKNELPPILTKLQADIKHKSTSTQQQSPTYHLQQQIQSLRDEMKVAIQEERFEDAAQLRDEVRKLELGLASEGGDSR